MVENPEIKKTVLDLSFKYKLSHLSSALNAVDVIKKIYDQKKIDERFVLSTGHAGSALYAVLEQKYPQKTAEDRFLHHHNIHPDRCSDCNLDCSTGSLGCGITIALGMALADRKKNVYCLISDGEAAEGSLLEALRIKRDLGVKNLIVHANINGFGAYRQLNSHLLACQLRIFDSDIKIHYPGDNLPHFLIGQQGHYRVMSEEDYQKGLKWLSI